MIVLYPHIDQKAIVISLDCKVNDVNIQTSCLSITILYNGSLHVLAFEDGSHVCDLLIQTKLHTNYDFGRPPTPISPVRAERSRRFSMLMINASRRLSLSQ
ncbi:hypothetical protein AKO1_003546 [Acrasis kona]|uniref:Uncharacterized protein n=1 Tax=Acrasis kona TaxID=1008807 RepID=A0AAW2ZD78_9EUKA